MQHHSKSLNTISITDTTKCVTNDSTISPDPNTLAAAGINLPSLMTDSLEARNSAPSNAPDPAAPHLGPVKCAAPPLQYLFAKTGISTLYDIPIRLTRPKAESGVLWVRTRKYKQILL